MYIALIPPLLQGFGLGAGLIIAIGPQNAFVLRQGLKQEHVFAIASICTLSDIALILLGIGGVGTLITTIAIVARVVAWCGAAFLFVYGLRSFKAAFAAETLAAEAPTARSVRLRDTLVTVLALSLLNPHAFLDTVVVLGSVGSQYHFAARIAFAFGAMLASFCWFFSLAYGAAWLAPLFRHPRTWRVLDVIVGCVMWCIAFSLLLNAI